MKFHDIIIVTTLLMAGLVAGGMHPLGAALIGAALNWLLLTIKK